MLTKYRGFKIPEEEVLVLLKFEELIGSDFSDKNFVVGLYDGEPRSGIRKLYLSDMGLKTIPRSIGNLKFLRVLSLSNNEITKIPTEIGNLASLDYLDLGKNSITIIPESIGNLKSLNTLILEGNALKVLPESLGNLKKLVYLYLDGNELKTLPESFGKLENLVHLYLNGKKLKTIPESFGRLKNLSVLQLNRNKIKTLPESFTKLENLKKLELFENELSELPPNIGYLRKLESLLIRHNKLKILPDSIGDLKYLTRFHLSENYIESLPSSINNLRNLKFLDLSYNLLTDLPKLDSDKDLELRIDGNFWLNFTAIPNLFPGEKYDKYSASLQKRNLRDLIAAKEYYWDFILEKYYDTIIKQDAEIDWGFSLFHIKEEEFIDLTDDEIVDVVLLNDEITQYRAVSTQTKPSIHRKHPNRKKNYIRLLLVVEDDSKDISIEFLFPFIKNITITVTTNRGDIIPVVFTDFYFKKTCWEKKIAYQTSSIVKFDQGYNLEPYARLRFSDVQVEYEEELIPKTEGSNILNEKLDRVILFLENKFSNELRGKDSTGKDQEEVKETKGKIIELSKRFDKAFSEPLFPDVILKVGNTLFGWIGKLSEYLMAGIVFASALPSVLQFVLTLIWEEIPFWIELLTYLPLIIFIIIYFLKFLIRHRIPKI